MENLSGIALMQYEQSFDPHYEDEDEEQDEEEQDEFDELDRVYEEYRDQYYEEKEVK